MISLTVKTKVTKKYNKSMSQEKNYLSSLADCGARLQYVAILFYNNSYTLIKNET